MKNTLMNYLARFTTLNEEEQQAIVENLLIEQYKKGTVLLKQGAVPTRCYFVFKGLCQTACRR